MQRQLDYLTEIREVRLVSPWEGVVVVTDGVSSLPPGYAIPLDFSMRKRPRVF